MEVEKKTEKYTKAIDKLETLKHIVHCSRARFQNAVKKSFKQQLCYHDKDYSLLRNEIDELMEELLKEEKEKLESNYRGILEDIQKFKTMQKLLEDYFENYALLED